MSNWSSDELATLRRLWVSSAAQDDIAAALPDRTWKSINWKANTLKLRRPGRSTPRYRGARKPRSIEKWTPDRIELLTYLYPTAPRRILSLAFPFTTTLGIEKRAQKTGLARRAK